MSPSPSAKRIQASDRRSLARRGRWSWRRALGLGLCFGLGYSLTLRLLDLPIASSWKGIQHFGVKTFPGSELDSLRRQYGDSQQQIRGDLDLLDLEHQQKREAAELAKRQAEMAAREQQESQQPQAEAQGLDALPQEPDSPGAESPPVREPAPLAPSDLATPSLPPPPLPRPAPPELATPSTPAAPAPAANPPTNP